MGDTLAPPGVEGFDEERCIRCGASRVDAHERAGSKREPSY